MQSRPPISNLSGHLATTTANTILLHDTRASKHIILSSFVFIQQARVRAPNHLHTSSSSSLYARHAILEHQTFGRCDFLLFSFFADACVDGLESEEIDVWCGFAFARGDSWVVAEDTVLLLKDAEDVFQVFGLEAEVVLVRGGGKGNVDVWVRIEISQ